MSDIKIGDEIVRIANEWNLMKVGDIRTVDGLHMNKNGILSVHLKGDREGTVHSTRHLKKTSEVDIEAFRKKNSDREAKKLKAIEKCKTTKTNKDGSEICAD